jgi:hypothetical protein
VAQIGAVTARVGVELGAMDGILDLLGLAEGLPVLDGRDDGEELGK